jgi:hypothetical protein
VVTDIRSVSKQDPCNTPDQCRISLNLLSNCKNVTGNFPELMICDVIVSRHYAYG